MPLTIFAQRRRRKADAALGLAILQKFTSPSANIASPTNGRSIVQAHVSGAWPAAATEVGAPRTAAVLLGRAEARLAALHYETRLEAAMRMAVLPPPLPPLAYGSDLPPGYLIGYPAGYPPALPWAFASPTMVPGTTVAGIWPAANRGHSTTLRASAATSGRHRVRFTIPAKSLRCSEGGQRNQVQKRHSQEVHVDVAA